MGASLEHSPTHALDRPCCRDGLLHARLGRPYENRGVIPHYKHYEQPFLRWLISTGRNVDYLADADLDASSTTGRRLADAYDLIVFPGHHE